MHIDLLRPHRSLDVLVSNYHSRSLRLSPRRKNNDTMTVHTMCHNPTLPLEGVDPELLLNFTTAECHMVPQPAEDGDLMVCGCDGEQECNDKLIFDKGANGEHMNTLAGGGINEQVEG